MKDITDIDDVMDQHECFDPCVRHAIKQLLNAGKRGDKDREQTINNSVSTLNRRLEMMEQGNEL